MRHSTTNHGLFFSTARSDLPIAIGSGSLVIVVTLHLKDDSSLVDEALGEQDKPFPKLVTAMARHDIRKKKITNGRRDMKGTSLSDKCSTFN